MSGGLFDGSGPGDMSWPSAFAADICALPLSRSLSSRGIAPVPAMRDCALAFWYARLAIASDA